MRALPILLAVLATAPVTLAGQDGGPPVVPSSAAGAELRLRPGDAVRLNVMDSPGLDCAATPLTTPSALAARPCEYVIDPSGVVLLPLIGAVPAAGVPFDDVRREILARYERELVEPAMTVSPVMRIAVLGEVRAPGLLHLDASFSLADVLASAGGLTPDGDPDEIVLVRDGADARLALGAAGAGVDDLRLRPGDRIVVGRRSWFSRNQAVVVSGAATVLAAVLTSLILR